VKITCHGSNSACMFDIMAKYCNNVAKSE